MTPTHASPPPPTPPVPSEPVPESRQPSLPLVIVAPAAATATATATAAVAVKHSTPSSVDGEPVRKRIRQDSTAPTPAAALTLSPRLKQSLDPGVTYNFVDNEFVLSRSRSWIKVFDPATQAFVTRVPESTHEEIVHAVSVAAAAQPAWAALSAKARRVKMLQLLALLRDYKPVFCHHISVEVGKTTADAEAEFERGLDAIESACATTNELPGQHVSNAPAEVHTVNEPLGVCLAITPFNFPFMIPLWSIPYALLAGNTMVLKPSERTPTAAQVLAECFVKAGLPAGVLSIVHGTAGVVSHLLAQPAIRAVNFVGSDVAGEAVYEHAKATRKRVQAECSGKNHGVVVADAARLSTLFAIAGSAFGAAGQRCMALSVAVLVGETAAWVDELVRVSQRLVLGCGRDAGVDVGPLITREAKRRVEDLISGAEAEGATVALDGRGYKVHKYPDGNFVGPTILTGVKPYMTCYQEEIFGPVLVCVTVDTLEEAVALINDNRSDGNGCTIFTSSPATAQKFQRSVNVGQIGVNVPILAPSGPVLRSGNKDSFLGEVNVHGRSYWQFYTQTKTITTLWS
ncbi:hypothetical protein TD95_003505 [Thielaviopsis punctulata]|uniref:methylmalonate-semialdehyde dehydrogenase (CoA acylating) n=1 Tax=Thielaviopsis punctulata TaxID=72032 RepID=A0A0F4ZKT1_9PEZI|nr:hypothetical protein TD95_004812 [Thielaviopsis punctulata]KKA30741.1 hypothetical protein TD95_003505 [Thielaviopsis punctulata]